MTSQAHLTRGLLEDSSEPSPLVAGDSGIARSVSQKVGTKALIAIAAAVLFSSPLILTNLDPQLRGGAATAGLNAAADEPDIWTPDTPGLWETQAFEALLHFQMPYMDFGEDIYVFSDHAKGCMRLSYWSGANVFLINTTGSSFELVPVAETESCLITKDVRRLELVIPDLKLFRDKGTYRKLTLTDAHGVESVGYEFLLNVEPLKLAEDGHFQYFDPKDDFVGVYTFIVNASSGGTPVSLTFRGHNAFLVQSHSDEYRLYYRAFHPRPEGIDRSFFTPPIGMPCTPYSNPTGPFGQAAHARPMHDISMFMPGLRGDEHRHSVVQDAATQFNKTCNSFDDCQSRRQLALRHYRWVQAANRRPGHYKVALNHMLDWTPDERFALLGRRDGMLNVSGSQDSCGVYDKTLESLPQDLDWRHHGLVGPPRDQGTCGSCWAFGTIGMLEGQLWKTGVDTRLSEQHLVDCSWKMQNHACDGGNDASALSWLLQYNGGLIPTEKSYGTYLSENGFCHFDKSKHLEGLDKIAAPPPGAKQHIEVAAQLKSCWHVAGPEKGGVNAAIARLSSALVSTGPISISIMARHPDFYYYAFGVYDNPLCLGGIQDLNHVVLLTGYGTDADFGEDYWTIRNSWSTHWGESGFARVAQKDNICGVATTASFGLL